MPTKAKANWLSENPVTSGQDLTGVAAATQYAVSR